MKYTGLLCGYENVRLQLSQHEVGYTSRDMTFVSKLIKASNENAAIV
jgi:hypothetical protein